MKILDIAQGSKEWLDLRRLKVTSTDVAAIMGLDPYCTPYQKWMDKMSGAEKEITDDMKRGMEYEEEAREAFNSLYAGERELLKMLPHVAYRPIVAISDEYPWMMASIDGWDGKSLLEIKCPRKIRDQIPEYHHCQMQAAMAVTGDPFCHYFQWVGGKWDEKTIGRDQRFIDEMIPKTKEFYQRMLDFDPPPMTDKDFQDMSGNIEWRLEASVYDQLREKKEAIEQELKASKAKLVSLAGEHSAKGHGIKVTKVITRGRIDYDAIPILKEIDLEPYRKPTMEIWRVT